MAEEYVRYISSNAIPKDTTIEEIESATSKDPTLQKVVELHENGQWHTITSTSDPNINKEDLKIFSIIKQSLTVNSNLLLKNSQIVIPKTLLTFQQNHPSKIPHLPESPTPVNKHIDLAEKEGKVKEKAKEYYDKRNHTKKSEIKIGDQVLVRQQKKNSLTSRYSTTPYTVTGIEGSKVIAQNDKHKITRNKSFFKTFKGSAKMKDNESDDSESEDEFGERHNQERIQPRFRYPVRDRMMPNFYGTIVTH
eukprot:gene19548-21480_t